jgi:hypothetical protein
MEVRQKESSQRGLSLDELLEIEKPRLAEVFPFFITT